MSYAVFQRKQSEMRIVQTTSENRGRPRCDSRNPGGPAFFQPVVGARNPTRSATAPAAPRSTGLAAINPWSMDSALGLYPSLLPVGHPAGRQFPKTASFIRLAAASFGHGTRNEARLSAWAGPRLVSLAGRVPPTGALLRRAGAAAVMVRPHRLGEHRWLADEPVHEHPRLVKATPRDAGSPAKGWPGCSNLSAYTRAETPIFLGRAVPRLWWSEFFKNLACIGLMARQQWFPSSTHFRAARCTRSRPLRGARYCGWGDGFSQRRSVGVRCRRC
jgi:hypothetical protein